MTKLMLKDNNYKGVLFSFCGIDGSGKSTHIFQVKKLLESKNINCIVVKEPSSKMRKNELFRNYIDKYNNEHNLELSLLSVQDRIKNNYDVIVPALQDGKVVLCDRYFYSCLAHHIINGYKNDEWIYDLSKYLIKPDVSFMFEVSTELAIKRVKERNNEKNRNISYERQSALNIQLMKIANDENHTIVQSSHDLDSSINLVLDIVKRELIRKGIVKNKVFWR